MDDSCTPGDRRTDSRVAPFQHSADKGLAHRHSLCPARGEAIGRRECRQKAKRKQNISTLPHDATLMFKLTIPTRPGLYAALAADPRVLQVLVLSGGYRRGQACELLAKDPSMIAGLSRALLEGLSEEQSTEQFNAQLETSVAQIFEASVTKSPGS